MPKPTVQQCHAMTTYYVKLFKKKYGTEPSMNRHAARWGFESVLTDMTTQIAKELLEFYFTTASDKRHDLEWFLYHYHELMDALSDVEKDRTHRDKLRRESEQRAKEWRERGNTGIANN